MSLFLNFCNQNIAPRHIEIKNMKPDNTTVELSSKGVLKVKVQAVKQKYGNERTLTTVIKEKQLEAYLVKYGLLDKVRCFVVDDVLIFVCDFPLFLIAFLEYTVFFPW